MTTFHLLSATTMREADRVTIEEIGVPGPVLMENAGRAAYARAVSLLGGDTVKQTLIIAGPGNNGGDGLVVARHLVEQGFSVKVVIIGNEERMSPDAALNYRVLKQFDVVPAILDSVDENQIIALSHGCSLIVDSLLGTGIKGAPRGTVADVIKQINACSLPVLSLDIPSGVEAETGAAADDAVQAVETVTFGALKIGLVLYPGAALAGRTWVARIGIPPLVIKRLSSLLAVTVFEDACRLLPRRAPDAHKGNCGRVLVLGGSPGLTGAPVMAGRAAHTVGAGLTTVAVPRSLVPLVAGHLMEVMHTGVDEESNSTLDERSLGSIGHLLDPANALVAGCGASRTAGVKRLILHLLAHNRSPLVLDADGLNALEGNVEAVTQRTGETVLTPHPGEMARLTGESTSAIVADPISAARDLADQTGAVIVLKTARTIVASPRGCWVNLSGNAGLASGGTGDVLAGMIGGFLAQGVSPDRATRLAVFLQGFAGDMCARDLTVFGTTAGSVLTYLPLAMRAVRDGAGPDWLGYRYLSPNDS